MSPTDATAAATTDATAAALARLYDRDMLDDPGDIDLWIALADRADLPAGPVLELMAGTGRVAIPLAAAGHSVTAVDIDPAMLARARARLDGSTGDRNGPAAAGSAAAGSAAAGSAAAGSAAAGSAAAGPEAGAALPNLTLVQADARDVRLPDAGRYRLAFIALNSFLQLGDRAGQLAAVRTLAAHLAPGGIAAIDVWLPDGDDLARFDGRITLEHGGVDPSSGLVVTKAASAIHDATSGTIRLAVIYEEGRQGEPPARWYRSDLLRLVAADELRTFAEAAGLEIELIAGGYDLEPLGPGADRAVLIARRGV